MPQDASLTRDREYNYKKMDAYQFTRVVQWLASKLRVELLSSMVEFESFP